MIYATYVVQQTPLKPTWDVMRITEHAAEVVGTFPYKYLAVIAARFKAKREHKSDGVTTSVRLRNRKGRYMTEWTYGTDPRSPG